MIWHPKWTRWDKYDRPEQSGGEKSCQLYYAATDITPRNGWSNHSPPNRLWLIESIPKWHIKGNGSKHERGWDSISLTKPIVHKTNNIWYQHHTSMLTVITWSNRNDMPRKSQYSSKVHCVGKPTPLWLTEAVFEVSLAMLNLTLVNCLQISITSSCHRKHFFHFTNNLLVWQKEIKQKTRH